MTTKLIIPARMAASRFPGKMLKPIAGFGSVIEYSYRAASQVAGVDQVVVATEHQDIVDAVEAFGGTAVMTSPDCANGTERVAEVARQDAAAGGQTGGQADLYINFQGDAPLIGHWIVEALIAAMAEQDADMATPVIRCTPQTLDLFQEDRRNGRVGGTTAVFDDHQRALYFSKEVLPYGATSAMDPVPVFHHVGLYAYRPDALIKYTSAPSSTLEQLEGLEQLRFLDQGLSVRCVPVEDRGFPFWEVNNAEDIPRIEAMLADKGEPNGLTISV